MKCIPALLLSFFTFFFLPHLFAQENENIINRWVVAGKLVQGDAFPFGSLQEYEFFKDNRYKIYDSGVATVNGIYELAKDGKSFQLKSGQASLTVKVLKLTELEMNVVYDIGLPIVDTMVFYSSGTPLANVAIKKFKYAAAYFNNWDTLKLQYTKRDNLAIGLILMVRGKLGDSGDSMLKTIREYILKAGQLSVNGAYIPRLQLMQYSFVQESLSDEINKLVELADSNSNFTTDKNFIDTKRKLADIEKEIEKARIKFNASLKLYNNGS